ncbi:hypothetical protein B0A55_09965, partial [Friedmanniomyces simplex]
DVGVRSEVELACEEVLLESGVGVFVGLLGGGGEDGDGGRRVDSDADDEDGNGDWAVSLLRAEIARTTDRESLASSDQAKARAPPSLILSLRSALAAQAQCGTHQVVTKMWGILSGTGFEGLRKDGEIMGKVVRGEQVGMGMRRMGI